MFNFVWYHGTIRRYIVLFGTIFNQIYITKTDESGAITSMMRVPITYGPADKVIKRVTSDPELNRPFGSVLPYMTFQMLRMSYDGSRHLTKQGREVKPDSNKNLAAWTYNPVPFNFLFELNVIVKNAEDGIKIIEQILPFFAPNWTSSVRIIDDPIIEKDISLGFIDHDSQDNWNGSFEERRYIRHILRFELQGFLFGPIQKSRIIKKFEGNFGTIDGISDAQISVYPGLTEDGYPTSDPALTIDYSQINWEDDYGFIEVKNVGGEDVI